MRASGIQECIFLSTKKIHFCILPMGLDPIELFILKFLPIENTPPLATETKGIPLVWKVCLFTLLQ